LLAALGFKLEPDALLDGRFEVDFDPFDFVKADELVFELLEVPFRRDARSMVGASINNMA